MWPPAANGSREQRKLGTLGSELRALAAWLDELQVQGVGDRAEAAPAVRAARGVVVGKAGFLVVGRPRGTPVWVKLAGVYMNEVDIESIREPEGIASFINPQPGLYMLIILSPSRILCSTALIVNNVAGRVVVRNADGCPIVEALGRELST